VCEHRITRREAFRAGAAVALPLAGAALLPAQAGAAVKAPTVGVSTLGFPTYTNGQLAQELAAQGILTVQLFLSQSDSRYWVYNGRSDVSDMTPERCKAVAETYRSAGIALHSIGVYTNLIHPDKGERKANLAYFEAMMRIGDAMDVRSFVTEAGHYNAEGAAAGVPHHFQEAVWNQMVATGKELARIAEDHGATVLFEPFFRGFLASAKRTRLFLEAVDSPRIRALLDPANLLEVNDLEEMFTQLGPWIECLHAKDRKLHVDRGVPAGQGDLDYPQFVAQAAARTPHAPLILEYVGPDDYEQAVAMLQDTIRQRHGLGDGRPAAS